MKSETAVREAIKTLTEVRDILNENESGEQVNLIRGYINALRWVAGKEAM